MEVVKGAAEDVNHTKGTVDVMKRGLMQTSSRSRLVKSAQQVETQTAYILVPVDKQRVGERNISADMKQVFVERAQQTKNLNID